MHFNKQLIIFSLYVSAYIIGLVILVLTKKLIFIMVLSAVMFGIVPALIFIVVCISTIRVVTVRDHLNQIRAQNNDEINNNQTVENSVEDSVNTVTINV